MSMQVHTNDFLNPGVLKAIAEAMRDMADANLSEPEALPEATPQAAPVGTPKAKRAVAFIVDKLSQPSTIRGILMLATSLGLVLSPGAQEYIIEIGLAVVGLVGIWADK